VTSTVSVPCLICATALEFPAGSRSVRCPICEDERPLPVRFSDSVPGHLVGGDGTHEAPIAAQSAARTSARCPACLATFSAARALDRCPHCGQRSPLPETSDPVLLTSGRLPFLLDRNAAWAAANSELSRHSLVATMDAFTPLYLPWLLVSVHVSASYEGRVGYEVEEYVNGTTRVRVEWTQAIGTVERPWDNRGGCASIGLPTVLGDRLAPWDFAFAEPVTLDELGDVPVEHIRRDLADVFTWAVPDFAGELRAAALDDMLSKHRQLLSVHPTRHDERVRLILVPVWLGRTTTGVRYAINARTGEVVLGGLVGSEPEEDQLPVEPDQRRDMRLVVTIVAVIAMIGLLGWLMMS
jgi:LSD1 subclass zinc finger protein